eukprot:CAMPEP_0119058880 /NCGR_PEP_ID=MMETSP1178-20130426/3131_1 /TAXON_ID=33656 /ORGANISM="unid sp, Strain CCMP2000" /LENGTH=157 /DNA_ID=CAMNT_0007039867 /DNA_START=38 /DNA_END=511 /DNA_ORIENTATION=+
MWALVIASAAFVLPPSRLTTGKLALRAPPAKAEFELPKLPDFGGLPKLPDFGGLPKLPDFGGSQLELRPGDLQFRDVDGELVTLRSNYGKVDLFVDSKLRLSNARLIRNGDMLEISGEITKGTPLGLLGFNLKDYVTEGVTPADPADADRAMALVGQ